VPLAGALVLATALGIGCGGAGGEPAGSTLDRVREAGLVRVGYANEAPYAYRDTASGRVTGEAPEIARVVFTRLGVGEIEGVLTEFGSLIPGLQAGRFDVIAAGMYVTPERCAEVAFSDPSYAVGEGFIVAAGNPLALHGYEAVRERADATLGVVSGTIERTYALRLGIPESRLVTFPDALAAMAAVRAGRVSAYAGTALTVQSLLAKKPAGVEQALPFTDPSIDGRTVRGYGAFAFRRDDRDLVEAFNRHLEAFVGTPEHLALVAPFGFTRAQLPEGADTGRLCGGA
jgi:polar amino acid transport system substrate-binding protein